MLEGLMQHDFPLTLQHVRDRMCRLYGDSEIVSVRDGERSRANYGEVVERADRLASALADLGVGPGARVATFLWNTREHLEAYGSLANPSEISPIAMFEDVYVRTPDHLQRQFEELQAESIEVERARPTVPFAKPQQRAVG